MFYKKSCKYFTRKHEKHNYFDISLLNLNQPTTYHLPLFKEKTKKHISKTSTITILHKQFKNNSKNTNYCSVLNGTILNGTILIPSIISIFKELIFRNNILSVVSIYGYKLRRRCFGIT